MSEDKTRLPKLEMPKLSREALNAWGASVEEMGKAVREFGESVHAMYGPKLDEGRSSPHTTLSKFLKPVARPYQCHKCGEMLANYEVFESGWPNKIRHWCMNHIPLRSRIRLWWQERGEW